MAPELLLEQIANARLSSSDVTDAFLRRAVIAHSITNCLCDIFPERAMQRAKELDDHLAAHGTLGPLHGLPISLKNQIDIEGLEMNMCYVGWTECFADQDAVLVSILEQQGAILFSYTNLSQGLLSSDTVNNLYGRTVSPYNRELCVGGSSGGEGGLVGLKGSPLGVGSDLGGSVRIPAAFNGLYGMRPSSSRVPYGGAHNSQDGQEANSSCLGPLSPTVAGLRIFLNAVLLAKPWRLDPLALRMPWNEDNYQLAEHGGTHSELCFGLMWDNGHVLPNPPYYRAMELVRNALIAAGHRTIDVEFPDAEVGQALFLSMLTADGGADLREACETSGEPLITKAIRQAGPPLTTHSWWNLTSTRRKYISKQLETWQATSSRTGTNRAVDAIIMPVAPYPSFPHGEEDYVFYTAFCNLCDYPASTFPTTSVDRVLDINEVRDHFLSNEDYQIYTRYDSEYYHGMPIGLQLVGQKGEDEAVIRMTEIVAAALGQKS